MIQSAKKTTGPNGNTNQSARLTTWDSLGRTVRRTSSAHVPSTIASAPASHEPISSTHHPGGSGSNRSTTVQAELAAPATT
jgi:hypothetical protein